jgi:hypothetical protein
LIIFSPVLAAEEGSQPNSCVIFSGFNSDPKRRIEIVERLISAM